VAASPADRPAADAALRAVLRRGLRLPPAGLLEPITVEWPGDVEALAEVIERRLQAPMDAWEPETLSDAELARISRAPQPTGEPTPVDSGDRQMVWAFVVALLLAEWWMREGTS
jgi:hypothetical protein